MAELSISLVRPAAVFGACRPKTPHCSDHSIAGSIKGDLAHVEEPRWPDTLSLVAALNFYSPDPPPPGL